ncbi:MAG TPA: hypothetical protein VNO21_09330, partial [Polyangiaceae bacterium]|nr:hypothetical protein [Polyangiaceae bacterium]
MASRCVVVGLLGLLDLAACHGRSDASLDAAVSIESPVPVPEGLLAEAVVLDPNASWGRVQRGTGGALALMPMNIGGLVTSLAALDPALGPEVDGAAPAFGAVAVGASGALATGDVSYACAVHLLDERRTRGTLFEGPNARYVAREAYGMTLVSLAPSAASAALPMAIAVSHGGFLVAARNEADLGRLGPYVSRTLPGRTRPNAAMAIDIPRSALGGPISPALLSLWSSFRTEMERQDARMREAHGGRAPDFGDPRAIVEMSDAFVKDKVGILADLDHARILLDPTEDA